MTKAWTFEYVTREVPKVPPHIPVLVLANFIDKAHHRVISREQALGFIEHLWLVGLRACGFEGLRSYETMP